MKYLALHRRPLLVLAVLLFAAVWVKNAWVCDDAYINFRSLDQLRAGHGPIWNPGERVQVYTSVLWYWLQAPLRFLTADIYASVLLLSLTCGLFTLSAVRRLFQHDRSVLMLVLLMVGSAGFMDFTSSGLENPLVYLVCVLLLDAFFTVTHAPRGDPNVAAPLRRLLILAGTALLVRHDLALLWLPPVAQVIIRHRRLWPWRTWLATMLMAAAPLLLWSAFALFYYGSPWPNAALAKLSTGMPQGEVMRQGLAYLGSHRVDPLFAVTIVAGLGVAFWRRSNLGLALGMLLHIVYLVWSGGDFMTGRFLSSVFLVAAILVVREAENLSGIVGRWVPMGAVLLMAVLLPGSPLTSSSKLDDQTVRHGVAHERGVYFQSTSLWVRRVTPLEQFPVHEWATDGRHFRNRDDKLIGKDNVGFFGYTTGLDKLVFDRLAITSPFLARIPVSSAPEGWRVGHLHRVMPRGYTQTLQTGVNSLAGPAMRELYDDLHLATSAPLLTPARFGAIWRLNIGHHRR